MRHLSALFLFFLFFYILTTGGHIVSSDGNTMFLLTRSIVEDGTLSVPYGNAFPGKDGKLYPKAGIGQAVFSIPLFLLGKLFSSFASPGISIFLEKFIVSLLSGIFTAGSCLILFLFGRALGFRDRNSFIVSIGYGISTFAWPYAKYYTSESILSFFFLSLFYSLYRARKEKRALFMFLAGLSGFFLLTVKTATLLLLVPASIFVLTSGLGRRSLVFFVPVLAGLGVAALYNYLRFGSLTQSGYMEEATFSAFSTPILVGLYGLLLSSGKSVFLYAPILILSLLGLGTFFKRERSLALLLTTSFLLNLILYAKFRAWAGDGSWGPRYLLPLLAPMLLPLHSVLEEGAPGRSLSFSRRLYGLLFAIGIFIQIGGSSIYYGSYLREIEEYPYTREFADPRFLADSHFNPRFSPVAGHWKMLTQNLCGIRFGSERKVALSSIEEEGGRIPLREEEKEELRKGIDYWFYYASNFGVSLPALLSSFLAISFLTLLFFYLSLRNLTGKKGEVV